MVHWRAPIIATPGSGAVSPPVDTREPTMHVRAGPLAVSIAMDDPDALAFAEGEVSLYAPIV